MDTKRVAVVGRTAPRTDNKGDWRAVSMEELNQRGYLKTGDLRGDRYGDYEVLEIGSTSVRTLAKAGLSFTVASQSTFPCTRYRRPRTPGACKPDRVYAMRIGDDLIPFAVAEWKDKGKFRSGDDDLEAAEQAIVCAEAMGVKIALSTDGSRLRYLDVVASLAAKEVIEFPERRDLNPAVLSDLYRGETGVVRDPKPLAESVWQLIWIATKAEPKDCLLTFVEIFMLKFLSENLPLSVLAEDYRFDALMAAPADFARAKGSTQIEYYVQRVRPEVKRIFNDTAKVKDKRVLDLFGLDNIASPTSIIDGFVFQKTQGAASSIASYNRTFYDILKEFQRFGPLTNIDPEFKMRLYETFLRRSARQQRLGQFFTPRNIVRPMIHMAELGKLEDNAVVLDPAAGVGGFVLEPLLFDDALPGNVTFKDGKPEQRVALVGVDVDVPTNILAKANMLLHLAESVRDPHTTESALNQALVNTFILMNENETLGALLHPPRNSVDVILTNPPYLTQGSAIYREEIEEVEGAKNGVQLKDYYSAGGLGLEALFLRYISGALKPGGRAFIIVPLGLLNRTAARMKKELLSECNIIASIQLPRNAFFNTPQPTYIIALEKRHTQAQSRPAVFCGIARSIGETLDYERVPTPDDNDLELLASRFVQLMQDGAPEDVATPTLLPDCPIAKLVPASAFSPRDRWDVFRHWTEEEHVALGERAQAVDRAEFIVLATDTLRGLIEELEEASKVFAALTAGPMTTVSLADTSQFTVRSGVRIRNVDLREHPGDVPVYSVFTRADTVKGHVDETWLREVKHVRPEYWPSVTVMATGASAVGMVFYREADCVMTDDVVIVEPWPAAARAEALEDFDPDEDEVPPPPSHDIDLRYLAVALARAIAQGSYLYEAKLYTQRVRQLEVEVPVLDDGSHDVDRQRAIADAASRLDDIRRRLEEAGQWSRAVRLA